MLWIDRDSTCSTLLMYWKNNSYWLVISPSICLGSIPP